MIARKWGALLPTILAMAACDKTTDVAGTNNETHTKGTLFQANGKVAAGARVRIFAADQNLSDSLPVTQTQVDANGQIPLKLKSGFYSLLADDTAHNAVFIDSVYSDGDTVRLPTDTLRKPGVIVGHVRVQPWHSPSIAWVHLMRTDLFAKVDTSGTFTLSGVPAGTFDLVAACDLGEYTPTHRRARSFPDSTWDVGVIDLVYNGLPPVTGLHADYDTLSGVVALRWHDTTYARKMGYLIYRRNDSSSAQSRSLLAYTTVASYRDTVFGGIGSMPNRFDSAEFDLTYWIGTKATDQKSASPLWNEIHIHVKSPAQTRLWRVTWDSIPIGIDIHAASSIDTTESGLLLLGGTNGGTSYMAHPRSTLLRRNLHWDPTILHDSGDLWFNRHVFWKGRVWQFAGFSTSHSLEYAVSFDRNLKPQYKLTPIYDSILIRSSCDGSIWDSIRLAIGKDSVTSFQFRPHPERLEILFVSNQGGIAGVRSAATIPGKLSTLDGTTWRGEAYDPSAPGAYLRAWTYQLQYSRSIGPGGDVWTEANRLDDYQQWQWNSPNGWLIPGEDIDTSHAVLQTFNNLHMRSRGDLLAVGSLYIDPEDSRFQSGYSVIALVSPDNPIYRQRIDVPELILDFCFWQGNLVMLSEKQLYFAHITKSR